jgi:hypothetical protein
MVVYSCTRCRKEFYKISHYKRHINRKNKCKENTSSSNNNNLKTSSVPKLEHVFQNRNDERYICNYCNRSYSRRPNLNKHLKTCKRKEDNLLKEELFNLLLENQKKQQEKQDNYEKRIEQLQEQILNLNTGTVNYYTTNNTTNNTQNIQVLAYEKTDISHLKDKDYKKVLRRGNFCVPNLVDAIHFNPNKPENHNIYIPNMKTGYIMCWNGKSWDVRNREDVIDDIYDDKSNLLIDKLDEWEEIGYKLDPIIMTKFNRFLGKMDDDIVKNKVKEEIRFLLYNNRNKIKVKGKTKKKNVI